MPTIPLNACQLEQIKSANSGHSHGAPRMFRAFSSRLKARKRLTEPTNDILPNELLPIIFNYYVHDRHGDCRKLKGRRTPRVTAYLDDPHTPVLLGQVCSRWRAVAHSTPTLWSNVFVNSPLHGDLKMFRFWIARSTRQLLDLCIVQHHQGTWIPKGLRTHIAHESVWSFYEILKVCLEHSQRWMRFRLQTSEPAEIALDYPWSKVEVPNLRHCEILRGPQSKVAFVDSQCDLYLRCCTSPVLQTLSIAKPHCLRGKTFAAIPWNKLLSIYDGYPVSSVPEVMHWLPYCTSLRDLTIEGLVDWPSLSFPIIRLPHLTDIRIACMSTRAAPYPELLYFLDLPALKRLSIGIKMGGESDDLYQTWQAVVDLGKRSKCRPTFFEIRGTWKDMSDGAAQILLTPMFADLVHLGLSCPISDNAISALTVSETHHPLPHLKAVMLDTFRNDPTVVKRFVRSRTRGQSAPLHFIPEAHYKLQPVRRKFVNSYPISD